MIRHFSNLMTVWFILFLWMISISIYGQNINPEFNEVFLKGELTSIRLSLSAIDKQALIYPDDPFLNQYFSAKMHFQNSLIDTVLSSVGIRIRGNTSRRNHKKSFKIDFKEFDGEQFFKLKKLNLKPNNNDPSQMREMLSWDLYRNMNVPAARTNYVELYFNNEYMGVYLNVENIDDEFVDRRFGNESGNLYKCLWGATLDGKSDIFNNDLYELKTNEETNDRSWLKQLVEALNSAQDENWHSNLEQIFDVDNYLRQLAVESLIGQWDGYSFNTNNYYLYENQVTNKIVFIPYDLDNTWGIDWIGHDWGSENILKWYTTIYKVPLTTKIISDEEYFNHYIDYLNELMSFWFNHDYIEGIASSHIDLLKEAIETDSYYPMDFGFYISDFVNSYQLAYGRHVAYSIGEYIEARTWNANQQMPVISGVENNFKIPVSIYPNPSNGSVIQFKGNINEQELAVFNLYGKKVEFQLNGQSIYFKNKLDSGIYLLKSSQEIIRFLVVNV